MEPSITRITSNQPIYYSIIIPVYPLGKLSDELTDACIKSVQANSTNFEILVISSPNSYATNVNLGLKLAIGSYIVILNNDTLVKSAWLDSLTECFTRFKSCGVASLGLQHYEVSHGIREGTCGAIWMLSRKIYELVGLLDETFKNSYCDSDYFYRVILAGYKCYRNYECNIIHHRSKTLSALNIKSEMLEVNKDYFYTKHGFYWENYGDACRQSTTRSNS